VKEFQAESSVLESTPAGPIIELRFQGEDRVTRGHKIAQFLKQQISDHQPVGIALNFQKCRCFYDADLGGIIPALQRCPCAILAKKRKVTGFREFLNFTNIAETFTVGVFEDEADGLTFLQQEISKPT
jgi:hypothetical protein